MTDRVTLKPAKGHVPCPNNWEPSFTIIDRSKGRCNHCGSAFPIQRKAATHRLVLHYVPVPEHLRPEYRDVVTRDADHD